MAPLKSKLVIVSTHSTNTDAKLADHFVQSGENTGNFIYLEALKNIFPSARVASISEIQAKIDEFREYDAAIWACANQLGAHTKSLNWAPIVEKLGIPNVLVGLGAQAASEKHLAQIPEGTYKWVKSVTDHNRAKNASNISTRGPISTSLLRMYDIDSEALTCPSITLIPRERVGIANLSRDFKRIAVAAGHTSKQTKDDMEVERILFKLVVETDGAYILQADRVLYGALSGVDEGAMEKARAYLSPNSTLEDFSKNYLRVTKSFVDIKKWEHELLDCQFMIGTRIHGIMLGRIAGLPSLLITTDSRTKELAGSTGTPNVSLKEFVSELSGVSAIGPKSIREIVEKHQLNSAIQIRLYEEKIYEFKQFFRAQGLIYDSSL